MAQAAVATEIHQALDAHADFAAQVALDRLNLADFGHAAPRPGLRQIDEIFAVSATPVAASQTCFANGYGRPRRCFAAKSRDMLVGRVC
jgi:hypothetical protein